MCFFFYVIATHSIAHIPVRPHDIFALFSSLMLRKVLYDDKWPVLNKSSILFDLSLGLDRQTFLKIIVH